MLRKVSGPITHRYGRSAFSIASNAGHLAESGTESVPLSRSGKWPPTPPKGLGTSHFENNLAALPVREVSPEALPMARIRSFCQLGPAPPAPGPRSGTPCKPAAGRLGRWGKGVSVREPAKPLDGLLARRIDRWLELREVRMACSGVQRTGRRCTATGPCWRIWRTSRATSAGPRVRRARDRLSSSSTRS